MTQSILILRGSLHGCGNTSTLADQLAAGGKVNRAKVESIHLHGLDIHACDLCVINNHTRKVLRQKPGER